MSYYDHTPKSGYGHNSHSYRVETYVEEVRKPRVVEYRYPSYSTKIDPTYTYNHDRSPEVDDLITKILSEVNGLPATTAISDSGTYRGHERFPVRVESKNYYTEDPWYSPYPSIRDYGSQYNDPSLTDHGVLKHRYQPPQPDLDYGHQPPKWEPEAYASKPETIKTFGVPRTYWGSSYQSDSPKYGGFQNQGSPKNQWGDAPMSLYGRHDYGGSTNPSTFRPEVSRDERDPNKRWGDSPSNSQTIGENGVSKGYRVPIYEYDDSPMKFHNGYATPNNPSVPSKPQSPKDHRAPYTQWGGSPKKSQIRQDYEVPVKPETPKDHRGPYTDWGGSPKNSYNRGNNGVLNNQQNLSSGPNVYQHPDKHSPLKFDTSKDYGSPENKMRNSPVNSTNFREYGDPSDHLWDSSSNPVYRQPPNTQFPSQPSTYNEQDYSPTKQQTHPNYTTPSNPWDKSPNNSYEPQSQSQSQSPPMTCKDGVCTLDDKPKVTHNPYDAPKDTYIRNHPNDTTIDHVPNDGRSSPYTLENQPKKDLQNTSGNNNITRTISPLGKITNNNIEEPLGQLNLTEGSSPKIGIGRSPKPTTLTSPWGFGQSAPIHSRPKTENPKDSTRTNIDSKETAKRYGGLGVPLRPYSSGEDQSKAISSFEALEKYNGSIVPK